MIKNVFFAQKFVLRKSVTAPSFPEHPKVGTPKRKVDTDDIDANRSFNYDYWLYGIGSSTQEEDAQPQMTRKKVRTKSENDQLDSEMIPAEQNADEIFALEETISSIERPPLRPAMAKIRDIVFGKISGKLLWRDLQQFMVKGLGCEMQSAEGSRVRFRDPLTRWSLVIHQPHNGLLRRDQRAMFCKNMQDHLGIFYEHLK